MRSSFKPEPDPCARSLRCDGLFEFDPLNFDVVVDELVDVSDDCPALDVHKNERWYHLVVQGRVRAGDGARVNVELSLVLVSLELVGVARDEDIAVQLPVYGGQCYKNKLSGKPRVERMGQNTVVSANLQDLPRAQVDARDKGLS